jgi:hypothetical protein
VAGAEAVAGAPKAPVPPPKLNILSCAVAEGADAAAPVPKILVPAAAAPNGEAVV